MSYDLLENPEQFTGYGTLLDDKSAALIWQSLYTDKFCFTSCSEETEAESSAEKRLAYRMVSGLQASVNTHIAMHYGFYEGTDEPATRQNWKVSRGLDFRPWKQLWEQRVGKFPDRIRNLHFVFSLMTRALRHLEPHLDRLLEMGAAGCPKCSAGHNRTKELLHELLSPSETAPPECATVLNSFDQKTLFSGKTPTTTALGQELKQRFQRMGNMMTCIGCDRCKLWGSLQFHAARVALGVIMSIDDDTKSQASASQFDVPHWTQLKPNDVVALVNALAQVSKSIDQAREWTGSRTPSWQEL